MPFATNQGIQLAYDVSGAGADLSLIAGTSADAAYVAAGRFAFQRIAANSGAPWARRKKK